MVQPGNLSDPGGLPRLAFDLQSLSNASLFSWPSELLSVSPTPQGSSCPGEPEAGLQ